MSRTFVGFGFGAIQGGLFLYEAFRSGNFDRLVVAEVMPNVVEVVRNAGGVYHVNIARPEKVDRQAVSGVEILNPTDPADGDCLVNAISEAAEIATALPSVEFFSRGSRTVAQLLAQGLSARHARASDAACVVYAGENNNVAAERLREHVVEAIRDTGCGMRDAEEILHGVQFLNTVIGKMSGVVADPVQILAAELTTIAPGLDRAFLVEAFNRILITRIDLPGFERGIDTFVEKSDLLPFEEAKLYGHNATHALVGYLAHRKGYTTMSEALTDTSLRTLAHDAFLHESGDPLIARYAGTDRLFTPQGYAEYVDDLLARMANPFLEDQVERIIRDPRRKLEWDDRLIGTMRLALSAGIEPSRFALGAAAALRFAEANVTSGNVSDMLHALWRNAPQTHAEAEAVISRIEQGCKDLNEWEKQAC